MAWLYVDELQTGAYTHRIACQIGESLYSLLLHHGIKMSGATCSGAGVCRGCKVYLVEDDVEAVACHTVITREITHVKILHSLKEQTVLMLDNGEIHGFSSQENVTTEEKKAKLGIAVDLGTTTIAAALVDMGTGNVLAQQGCMNRQGLVGADVISRIQYASKEAGLHKLEQLVRGDLLRLTEALCKDVCEKDEIASFVITGNTTMLHLLAGESVEGLAAYPFAPIFLDERQMDLEGLSVTLLPGKSAFVGADIVSGAQYLMEQEATGEKYRMLVDLGTNGEIMVWNHERSGCTSAACGPAFANSVAGAFGKESTLLDAIATCLADGRIDATGKIREDLFDTGIEVEPYYITQNSVRQIQLAKAAIRTAMELLCYEMKVPLDEVETVYLAGGFGFHLSLDSAFAIHLLPEELRGRIKVVGNTALQGAVEALRNPKMRKRCPVIENGDSMDLSESKNFQEFFVHRLNFTEVY